MIQESKHQIQEGLCNGRYPFAVSDLQGLPVYPNTRGRVEFYTTPAGVAISAIFTGLPGRGGVCSMGATYRFCLEGKYIRKNDRFCAMIPPLYEKDGNARFFVVTERILPVDLFNSHICIRADANNIDPMMACEIAKGEIICQPYCRKQTNAV